MKLAEIEGINLTHIFPKDGNEFWSKNARDMAQVLVTFGGFDPKELRDWLVSHVTIRNRRVQERHVLDAADEIYLKHHPEGYPERRGEQ